MYILYIFYGANETANDTANDDAER
ncbi:predicted protein [Streptomyces iranensis]|uniref:Uncharacterized protein n=1 Tax=Streptomyces iranensis TaxID=576784 RepID=A0A060ZMR0_9ACTN|nr:predicted protein [Streptomyces iranensis]